MLVIEQLQVSKTIWKIEDKFDLRLQDREQKQDQQQQLKKIGEATENTIVRIRTTIQQTINIKKLTDCANIIKT